LSIEEAEDGIRHANSTPDAVCFAIVDNKSLELLGNIALAFRANNRKSAEIMYWLVPWGRGRGMATNVVKLLCQWAFDALGLERVTLTTLVGNTRSQLVAERTGFQRQATDKSEGGTDADYLWFELTKN
jgi:RimJ/RimL family protein N-acetyltransferase